MSKINVLSKNVAQLIAAGEVVERPSSVIKEMIENSIDAGAGSVTVEIKNGGSSYLRITDDGCGIEKDDVKKVFISHATSKIKDESDLTSIGTLGFRGEAMASIAAVARVELLTRAENEQDGSRYVIEGGEELEFHDAGCPKGTTIVVRDLFFNTPARMKFLKKDVTEGNAVAGVVDLIALSHPEISFRLIREGKQTLLTPGDGNLKNAIYAVCGREFASSLISADYELGNVRVTGYICKPVFARTNRNMQYFFINGRFIKSKTCYGALSEAYKNAIMVGKFPACVLNIEMDHALVDVNVHPAKIEVRFMNERPVFETIYYACKSALECRDTTKEIHAGQSKDVAAYFRDTRKSDQVPLPSAVPEKTQEQKAAFWERQDAETFVASHRSAPPVSYRPEPGVASAQPAYETKTTVQEKPAAEKIRMVLDIYDEMTETAEELIKEHEQTACVQPDTGIQPEIPCEETAEQAAQKDTPAVPDFKIVGEAFKTYIFFEMENALYCVDKHAAHERMLFDALKAQEQQGTQILAIPQTVRLTREEYSVILDNLALLGQAGFLVEDFGNSNVIVRECPSLLGQVDMREILVEIAGKLLEKKTDVLPDKLDWIYHSAACRAAIKAGDRTSPYELEPFVGQLLSKPEIRYCPHGRPVMIKMTKYEIEKFFGRV